MRAGLRGHDPVPSFTAGVNVRPSIDRATSDSSVSMGAGSVMGQTGMGTMTWPLTQAGSTVTGSMSFSGMQGRMPN